MSHRYNVISILAERIRCGFALLLAFCSVCLAHEPQMPQDGAELCNKLGYDATLFYTSTKLELVYSMRMLPLGTMPSSGVLAATKGGVCWFSEQGQLIKTIQYATRERPWDVTILNALSENEIRFLGTLPDQGRTVLYGIDGDVVINLAGGYYTHARMGDVNGDGFQEFVVSSKHGLTIFDSSGKWIGFTSVPNLDVDFHLTDVDADGSCEIIVRTYEKQRRDCIRIIDAQGKLVSSWVPDFRFYSFEVVRWPSWDKARLLFLNGDAIVLTDTDGKNCMSLVAPKGSRVARVVAETLNIGESKEALLCVASARVGGPHIVYIWSGDGELLYQRLMVDSGLSILVPSRIDTKARQCFFVGSRNRIWKYGPGLKQQPGPMGSPITSQSNEADKADVIAH